MSEQDKPQNPEHIDWGNLEGEMQGAEQRAEAVHWGQVQQGASEIKDLLHQVLPAEVMASFEDTTPREPQIGADGNPVVTNSSEAYALAKQRPELAAIMAQTAHNETVAEQQQLDINVEAADKSGHEDAMKKAREDKAKLQDKVDRIEFWSAVVALHPIDDEYIKENVPYQFGGGTSHEGQVRLCMRVEDEMLSAIELVKDWSPRRIVIRREQYDELNKKDPNELGHKRANDWIDDMEKRAEEAYIKIDEYGRFLGSVVHGRTFPDGNPNLSEQSTQVEDEAKNLEAPNEYYEMLRTLPGTDPVLEVMNGRLKELPKSGWLIRTKVQPGHTGSGVTITRYEEGALEVEGHSGSLNSGEVHLRCKLEAGKYGDYSLSYLKRDKEGNKSDYRWLTDTRPQDVIELGEDRIIKGVSTPLRAYQGTSHDYVLWKDLDYVIDWTNRYGRNGHGMTAEMARITDNPDEAQTIVKHLAKAMGMQDREAAQFVDALAGKDVFKPLHTETATERVQREHANMLHNQEVIAEYDDGGKLVDRYGDRIMVEADGSEWVQYSSRSGLMYDGPDDLLGMYPE